MDVGLTPVFAKQVDKWLLVGQQEDAVTSFKQMPADVLENLSSRYDVGVKLDVQSIPAEMRDMWIAQFTEGFERKRQSDQDRLERQGSAAKTDQERAELQQKRDELKLAQETQIAKFDQLVDTIKNTKQMIVGLAADSANKQLYLDAASEFLPGSKLDAQITRSMSAKTSFAALPLAESPVTLNFPM